MRTVLIIVGAGLVICLLAIVANWARLNYVSAPTAQIPSGPFRHHGSQESLRRASARFGALSAARRDALLRNLRENIASIESWTAAVAADDVYLICLGEDHEESTREFLARELFTRLALDRLFLETTRHELGRISQELRRGRREAALLGVDIAGIMRAVRTRNPHAELMGIEETEHQRLRRLLGESDAPRDFSLYENLWREFDYGARHVILFGAFHCANRPGWLYGRIHRLAPKRMREHMRNVRVWGEHQDVAIESFVRFLDALGVADGDFVVTDTSRLDPLVYRWFDLLAQSLREFSAVLVFRH